MPRRISDETKRLMEELYAVDLPVAEIARRTGVPYATAYGYTRARQRINPETQQTFKTLTEYRDYQARKRTQKSTNQELSGLIQKRLTELGKTQKWLAEQLGITEGAVSRYSYGKTTPRKSLQGRLFEALEVPYQTLDDLLEAIGLE